MADKFEDLRTFAAIVNSGGVNAAATQLGIAKSAVSRRLSDLETRLGVSLVERASRRFAITAVGRDYHRQAVDILAALQRLEDGVASPDAQGEVTIAASTTILTHIVVPAIAAMGGHGTSPRLSLSSASGRADITITDESRPAAGKDAHSLIPARDVVVASPEYLERRRAPARPGEIREHEGIILGEPQKAGWRIANASVAPGTTLAVPDAETALAACRTGLGLALLPDFVARASLRDGTLIHVLRDAETEQRDIAALVHNDATPATRLIIDRLRGALGER